MSFKEEWHKLRLRLMQSNLSGSDFSNLFYQRLLIILEDVNAGTADKVSAYRDALLAAPEGDEAILPLVDIPRDNALLEMGGLNPNNTWHEIGLLKDNEPISNEGSINLNEIYGLKKRRIIDQYPIDPSLSSLLNDDSYKYYNGYAQQMAVRIGLTSNQDSTLIINLPTGSGKTLVAHALCGFSPANKLTLVIVPTIGLSIEQGLRAESMLSKMGLSHGGCYHWHGQQDKQLQDDIREKIRNGKQRILFCSPESACRSLLPALFQAAENNLLANIVVDEAHLVDQWGAGFRPDFQIFAAVFHSLRAVSKNSIKCCLMSATFTEKTLKILSELFTAETSSPIEIHGSFLRPEIQYSIFRVTENAHRSEVLNTVWRLPKPLIVYSVTRSDASDVFTDLCKLGFNRVGLFTGDTSSSDRSRLLDDWSLDKIDIMVATSAFGVGMDKADIRSVLHTAVPENLDRFYQEVGRAGRDGLACQSLLVYFEDQFKVAESLNNQRLISVDLGLTRWTKMWGTGVDSSHGKKIVNINTQHSGLSRSSDSNAEWNWRTLLLMQRSGMVEIELNPPKPPVWDSDLEESTNQSLRSDYYNQYYKDVLISPLVDSHMSASVWDKLIGEQRSYEKISQRKGFNILKQWVLNSELSPFCQRLQNFYTVKGRQPELVCGGCPGCRNEGRDSRNIPTVGRIGHVIGLDYPNKWHYSIRSNVLHVPLYYKLNGAVRTSKLIRQWIGWISMLLEKQVITAIRSDNATLEQINKSLPAGLRKFWVGIQLLDKSDEPSFWSELVLVMPDSNFIPDMGLELSPRIIVAPINIAHPKNYNNYWWEKNNAAKSLDNFISGLNYDNN